MWKNESVWSGIVIPLAGGVGATVIGLLVGALLQGWQATQAARSAAATERKVAIAEMLKSVLDLQLLATSSAENQSPLSRLNLVAAAGASSIKGLRSDWREGLADAAGHIFSRVQTSNQTELASILPAISRMNTAAINLSLIGDAELAERAGELNEVALMVAATIANRQSKTATDERLSQAIRAFRATARL